MRGSTCLYDVTFQGHVSIRGHIWHGQPQRQLRRMVVDDRDERRQRRRHLRRPSNSAPGRLNTSSRWTDGPPKRSLPVANHALTRSFTVYDVTKLATLPVVCWNSCEACPSIADPWNPISECKFCCPRANDSWPRAERHYPRRSKQLCCPKLGAQCGFPPRRWRQLQGRQDRGQWHLEQRQPNPLPWVRTASRSVQ